MTATRVLYISTVSELGGAERSLLSNATSRDPSAVYAVAALPSAGPLAIALRRVGVAVHIIPTLRRLRRNADIGGHASQLLSLLRGAVACARLAEHERVDIVHANTTNACLYAALAHRGAQRALIWHLRDFDATPAIVRLLMAAGAHVIAPSHAVAQQIGATYQQRVTVIQNGVAVPAKHSASNSRRSTRTVLTIGQLVSWKNHDRVIRVAEIVARHTGSAVTFRVAGGPAPGDASQTLLHLRESVRSLGLDNVVEILGPREDIGDLLDSADLLLHLAYPEPFGRVIVEAMLLGIPVVALAGDHGPAEIIKHQQTGVLLEDHSVHAAASCVLGLLDSPSTLQRFGHAARERAIAEYAPARAAAKLEGLYRRLVTSRA